MIAQQLDSLVRCKEMLYYSNDALDSCIQAVESRDGTIAILKDRISVQDANYKALQSVIIHKGAQISVLEQQAADLQGLIQKVDRRCKTRKFWGIMGGVLSGVGTGLLIGLIVK